MSSSAACVWRASPDLIVAIDGRLGEPVDTYVNGSQVWMTDDGPRGSTLEWRLHPCAGYQRPSGLATEEVFATVALAVGEGRDTPVPLGELWDGLEVFAAYEDDMEPAELAAAATDVLGRGPDAAGLVDHEVIGDAWERSRGAISIVDALLAQLGAQR
jgi:hypothetical protein